MNIWIGYSIDAQENEEIIVAADTKDKTYKKLFKRLHFTKEDLEGKTIEEFLNEFMRECHVDRMYTGIVKRVIR